jgi:hypothetical protein
MPDWRGNDASGAYNSRVPSGAGFREQRLPMQQLFSYLWREDSDIKPDTRWSDATVQCTDQ